jgi:acetyl-CoA carboxylase alpha subunit
MAAMEKVDEAIYRHLQDLMQLSRDELKKQRNEKIYEMGHHINFEEIKG